MQIEDLYTVDKHEAGAEMEILHPATGENTGVFLLLKGIDSRTFRAASAEFNRKRLAAKDAEIDGLSLDLSVAITAGWRGIERDGEPVPFSKDAVRELYAQSPAIRQQVDTWFQQRRNFLKG